MPYVRKGTVSRLPAPNGRRSTNELKASTDISSEAAAELDAILAELEETEAKLSKAEKELASTRSELDVTKANLEQAEKELAASDGQEPILELKPETITEPAKETTSVTKTIPTQKAEKEQTVWIASSGNGTKYHKSTCRTLKDGKTEITLSEAEAMGLTACKVCGG